MEEGGIQTIVESLTRFAGEYPEQAAEAARFIAFARSGDDVRLRGRRDGHFTASCWLISGDGERVLLTHHRKLGRWLQLGGHADGDHDLARVAWREALEESGLPELLLERRIFDIDAHLIPARGDEPEHVHWDVRYVVHCRGSEEFAVSEESLALAWVPVAGVLQSPDASLQRMARRWQLQRGLVLPQTIGSPNG